MNHDATTEIKAVTEFKGPPKKYTVPSPQEPSRCRGCPYPGVGFICWSPDGSCMKTEMNRIHSKKKSR